MMRRILSIVLNRVFRFVLKLPIRDLSSRFRLYHRGALEALHVESRDFDVLEEILVRGHTRGWRITEVLFHYMPRNSGASHARLIQFGLAYIKTLLKMRRLKKFIYNPKRTLVDTERIYQGGDGGREMAAYAELDEMERSPHEALRLPRFPEPADECDVMREQLEYLIGHATKRSNCNCSDCQRYLHVRSVLLEIFSEPEPQPVRRLTAVPTAA